MNEQGTRRVQQDEAAAFLERHPDTAFIETMLVDLNGIPRGKRVPVSALRRVYDSGINLPASTVVLDVWGRDVEASGLIFETGDADHPCWPVPGSLRPLPWGRRHGASLLLRMDTPAGEPFAGDPRNVLAAVLARFRAEGLTPVVATELEFRLFQEGTGEDGLPRPPEQLHRHGNLSQLYGLDELDGLEALLVDIEQACAAQGLPTDTIIAESEDGQYEINLRHVPDALLAADQAVLLKRTIKAVARRHGLIASFMAKPFGEQAGNGLHVHVSLLDESGRNVFAGEAGDRRLLQAVAGLTATMHEATAVFAPHANSFRRFQPAAHVPLAPTWGRDNRTTALRIPLGRPEARRVEHRVAGADANPYLVLAAVLGGVHHGLSRELTPPPETEGNAYAQHAPTLPDDWGAALAAFEGSAFIADYLGPLCQRLFSACKRQEREHFQRCVPRVEYEAYLGTI
ncbi:glutamine synthetase family protein [Spiribacter halobius]|uniref:Glutamine synthetase n=1 Tax=Sediminicurvatus halobius TaxID=2182432 RepID=A0A2U2N1J1_9GAMM|nr:glutamine synthetase family protein [Spiribacter halobius]PWG63095.1 glutamine synthetase [Spiribacter halobius]UEX77545.1 glutamine synthetase family protein [Spiribacter halobius]